MRRFVTAGSGDGLWLVAIEHGGISHYTAAMLFDSLQAPPVEAWCIAPDARSLGAVVESLRTGCAYPLDERFVTR